MPKECPKCASEISEINILIESKINRDMVCHWCIIVEENTYQLSEVSENEAIHD
jgi:hypothetical protein